MGMGVSWKAVGGDADEGDAVGRAAMTSNLGG